MSQDSLTKKLGSPDAQLRADVLTSGVDDDRTMLFVAGTPICILWDVDFSPLFFCLLKSGGYCRAVDGARSTPRCSIQWAPPK
jgi:hypothetical protein